LWLLSMNFFCFMYAMKSNYMNACTVNLHLF
jgi:hypothetical protein